MPAPSTAVLPAMVTFSSSEAELKSMMPPPQPSSVLLPAELPVTSRLRRVGLVALSMMPAP